MIDPVIPRLTTTREPTRRFQTRSWDDAVEFMTGDCGRHLLEHRERGPLDLQLAGFDFGELDVTTESWGAHCGGRLLDERDHWVFSVITHGSCAKENDTVGPGDAMTIAPNACPTMSMSSDLEVVHLRVGTVQLQHACRALLDRELDRPLAFPRHVRADSPMAAVLNRVVHRFAELPRYGHAAMPVLERRYQEAALFELLMVWPHEYSAELASPAALAPRSVTRARDFIHAHLHEHPSLTDIASAAGIGVRALIRGFHKWLGTTPMRYVLDCRLDGLRRQLLESHDAATVTPFALSWGFTNLGDFAAHYRRRFGELPHETLQRKKARSKASARRRAR